MSIASDITEGIKATYFLERFWAGFRSGRRNRPLHKIFECAARERLHTLSDL